MPKIYKISYIYDEGLYKTVKVNFYSLTEDLSKIKDFIRSKIYRFSFDVGENGIHKFLSNETKK